MEHEDTRHPLARARDRYFETEGGGSLLEGEAKGRYLRNRAEVIFEAGWDAAIDAIAHAVGEACLGSEEKPCLAEGHRRNDPQKAHS